MHENHLQHNILIIRQQEAFQRVFASSLSSAALCVSLSFRKTFTTCLVLFFLFVRYTLLLFALFYLKIHRFAISLTHAYRFMLEEGREEERRDGGDVKGGERKTRVIHETLHEGAQITHEKKTESRESSKENLSSIKKNKS